MEKIKKSDINFITKVIKIKRVTKVVKGGRRFRFSALVIVGNNNGIVGYGLGKANEVSLATLKGAEQAKKNILKIPIIHDTIPHVVIGQKNGGKILIKPASQGTGVIAGGGARIVFELAGIKNILSKSQGSKNSNNMIGAAFNALKQLRDPLSIAKSRNITLNKLFNG